MFRSTLTNSPCRLLVVGSLCLPAVLLAQSVRTLPETQVVGSTGSVGGASLATSNFTSADLDQFQVETLEDLAFLAPNLHFVDSDTRGYGNIVTARGLSNTLFFGAPAVGLYVDDVPFSDAYAYSSQLVRLDSATMHHGPQGAYFGRNAPGGLLELTTMQPGAELRYGGSVEYGTDSAYGVTAYSSGPLAAGLSHTLQFYWKERDGFVSNRTIGDHPDTRSVLGGLASIIWSPAADTEIKLRFAAERVNDGGQRLTALRTNPNPFAITNDPFQVASNLKGENNIDRYQLSLHGRKDFGWGTGKSITSYQNWDLGPQVVDLDLGPSPFPLTEANSMIHQDQELWTQEFRIESPEDAGPLSWRGGLFYSNKDTGGRAQRRFPAGLPMMLPSFDITELTRFDLEEETYAAYASAAYQLGNGLTLEAGGRVEYVDSSMNRTKATTTNGFPTGAVALAPSSEAVYFSPTAGLTYEVNEKVSVFARSGLGIKPHGYSAFSDGITTSPKFGEERNWSNEIGVQYNCEDCNLNAVVRAFWNDIEDYQLNVQDLRSTDFNVVNADEVTARGVEAELRWRPVDALLLHGSLGWTDTEFDDFTDPVNGAKADGNAVPFVPEFTASGGFRYDLPGGFFVASTVRAAGETFYDSANTSANKQGAYWIWDAQAGYEAEHWSVTVFGRNVLDEDYYTFINPQIAAGSPGDPQIFGVRVNLDLW